MKTKGLVRVFTNTAWTVKHLFKWLLLSKEEGEVVETENDGGKRKEEEEKEEEKKEVDIKEKIQHEMTNTEILLILLVITVANVLFIALGAYIFHSTEGDYQGTTRQHVDDFQNEHCDRVLALYSFNGPQAKDIIIESIKNYTSGLYEYLKDQKWDGGKKDEVVIQWTFTASVLYSLVVVTCIGYGDTTPISTNGRLLTIIFALIGIPLLLLLIAVMGDKMGLGFKYLYWYITCRSKKIQAQLDKEAEAKQKELEEQRALAAENDEPKTPPDERDDNTLVLLEEDGDEHHENAKEAAVAAVVEDKRKARREKRRLKRKMVKEMLIPLHISVLVFALYNLVGAALFAVNEDNWNFFESFYFSVITLSTVGFGDYVFGKSCDGQVYTNSEMKLIVASIYILVGLSLLYMCFSHMAQTFKNNFYDFGVMFGVLKKKEEVLV